MINQTLCVFITILWEMRAIYYDRSASKTRFCLEPVHGAYYDKANKMSESLLPVCIRNWIGHVQLASTCLNTWLNSQTALRMEPIHFCTSNYLFATMAGTFNVITGTYTATLPFVQFDKLRNQSIWPSLDYLQTEGGQRTPM